MENEAILLAYFKIWFRFSNLAEVLFWLSRTVIILCIARQKSVTVKKKWFLQDFCRSRRSRLQPAPQQPASSSASAYDHIPFPETQTSRPTPANTLNDSSTRWRGVVWCGVVQCGVVHAHTGLPWECLKLVPRTQLARVLLLLLLCPFAQKTNHHAAGRPKSAAYQERHQLRAQHADPEDPQREAGRQGEVAVSEPRR